MIKRVTRITIENLKITFNFFCFIDRINSLSNNQLNNL